MEKKRGKAKHFSIATPREDAATALEAMSQDAAAALGASLRAERVAITEREKNAC